MSEKPIRGIHHVTAISGPAQRNVDFYVGDLGLRMVKQTVNFDDPTTHHLYYGDRAGRPGSILTFFPWAMAAPGRAGSGTTESTAFAVPQGSLEYWPERLAERGLEAEQVTTPDGVALRLVDPDGMVLEIVEHGSASGGAGVGEVSPEHGIASFRGVMLDVPQPDRTARFLTEVFGYEELPESEGRLRFAGPSGEPGSIVDLVAVPSRAEPRMGRGSVHHVAFRTADPDEQLEWQGHIRSRGIPVTEVADRCYFESIYFREPGGVLFEIATDAPGFQVDEPLESLGSTLKLPPWYESRRAEIEERLPALVVPETS